MILVRPWCRRYQREMRDLPAKPRLLQVLCLLVFAVASAPESAAEVSFTRDEVTIWTADGGRHRFAVELALNPAQRAQGLMFRTRMAPDAGMLFVYPTEEPVAMWMKNTHLPLDMLFIRSDGRIVTIVEETVPFSLETISSGPAVKAVLELNAGTVARLGIKPGDVVVHPTLRAKP